MDYLYCGLFRFRCGLFLTFVCITNVLLPPLGHHSWGKSAQPEEKESSATSQEDVWFYFHCVPAELSVFHLSMISKTK